MDRAVITGAPARIALAGQDLRQASRSAGARTCVCRQRLLHVTRRGTPAAQPSTSTQRRVARLHRPPALAVALTRRVFVCACVSLHACVLTLAELHDLVLTSFINLIKLLQKLMKLVSKHLMI